MDEAKFRVGDVVQLLQARFGYESLNISECTVLESDGCPEGVPAGCEGVVKECTQIWHSSGNSDWIYGVAIPEARYFVFGNELVFEFIEHQPSPREIAAMYAEAG